MRLLTPALTVELWQFQVQLFPNFVCQESPELSPTQTEAPRLYANLCIKSIENYHHFHKQDYMKHVKNVQFFLLVSLRSKA
ncbi:hypothetical protein VIGAN_07074000 [Vigna angularis var. angularis]|uniref:Uncharacterized protein n=1 Tax=Vigna angularis var. angularis TaxID=157739 RepID=A0A0S3SGW8_PHAAN|nr:hypothetical protein VIGAN_07074000 [Vigna angularis var. angularis]